MVVTAIYENGVLRPLTPLALPERAEVQISIHPPAPASNAAHHQRVRDVLVAAGLSRPPSDTPPSVQPLSDAERAELAQRFTGDRPLADIIIEEREER